MSSKIHLSRLLKTLHEWRAAGPNSRTKWGKGNMFGNHCYYTSFYDEKNTCFRWEYLAPCGRIFCVSPSVGTNLTGRLQTMGTAMEIYQTPCGKWSNLPKLSTAMANLWELFFLKFCFTKPNEANTSCIHVLVSWLVLKQFSIFLLSYRSTSLET